MKKWIMTFLIVVFCFLVGWETADYFTTQKQMLKQLTEMNMMVKEMNTTLKEKR